MIYPYLKKEKKSVLF